MRLLKILLLLLLTCGASGLRGQSAREEIQAQPLRSDGIYMPYRFDNPALTPVPEGYEPFYISHFGRHGSRWLLHDSEYTELKAYFDAAATAGGLTPYGEAIRSRIEAIYADGIDRAGDLSPLGAAQHREIAGRMIATYPAVFRDSARIDARSTVVVRCVLSMAAFCERLKEVNSALRITRTSGVRITRLFNFFNIATNPDISPEYVGLPKSPAWKAETERFRNSRIDPAEVFGKLFTPTYAPTISDPHHLLKLLADARSSLHGLDTDLTLDDLFTPEQAYALWESTNYDLYRHRGPNPETKRYPEWRARVLLEDILARADAALVNGTPAADLRFGHDANLMSLVDLMDFEGCTQAAASPDQVAEVWRNYSVSPMAANIQLVFFRDKAGDVLVKMLHNEHEVRIPLASPTAPYYRWPELKAYYRKTIDDLPVPEK